MKPKSISAHASDAPSATFIVWEGRLDNRSVLLSQLESVTSSTSSHLASHLGQLKDQELVLELYQRSPAADLRDFCASLLGEFAFMIWDAPKQRLVAARDPFGVKPFFYFIQDQTFHFASSLNELSHHPQYSRQPDDTELMRFLLNDWSQRDRTYYKGIRKLPPGHVLIWSGAKLLVQPYFQLQPDPKYKDLSPEEAVSLFRQTLEEAIRSRIQQNPATGILFSGGLDSSTLAAFYRQVYPKAPVHLLSAYFEDPECDDRRTVEGFLREVSCENHIIYPESPEHRKKLELEDDSQYGDLYYNPAFFMYRPLFEKAREVGCTAVFTGSGGDDVFTLSPAYCANLFREGHPFRAWTELKEHSKDFKGWKDYFNYVLLPNLPYGFKRFARTLIGPSVPEWAGPELRRAKWLFQEISENYSQARRVFQDPARRDHYVRLFLWGGYFNGIEQENRLASLYGLTITYPLFDIRLIRAAFSLPCTLLSRGKRTKIVLREAGKGIVPEWIRTRVTTQHYDTMTARTLLRQAPKIDLLFKNSRLVKRGWVDPRFLEHTTWIDNLSKNWDNVLFFLNLERWLRELE